MEFKVGQKYKSKYGKVVTIDAVGTDHVLVIGEMDDAYLISKKTLGYLWTEVREPVRKKVHLYRHNSIGVWTVDTDSPDLYHDEQGVTAIGSAWITEGEWAD